MLQPIRCRVGAVPAFSRGWPLERRAGFLALLCTGCGCSRRRGRGTFCSGSLISGAVAGRTGCRGLALSCGPGMRWRFCWWLHSWFGWRGLRIGEKRDCRQPHAQAALVVCEDRSLAAGDVLAHAYDGFRVIMIEVGDTIPSERNLGPRYGVELGMGHSWGWRSRPRRRISRRIASSRFASHELGQPARSWLRSCWAASSRASSL